MVTEPVTATVHIDAPPERVYEYLTRPEAIVSWMGDYALLDARPGGRFHLDIKGAPVRGRFLHLDPPHRLVISWGYAGSDRLPPGASTIEIRLIADRGGTRVELAHRDLPTAERAGHASGWTHYLARLHDAATGRDPGPDPGMASEPQCQIRRAGAGDADAVAGLAAELAQSFPFSRTRFDLSYPALLAADGACLLLAEAGQERLGYLLGFRHLTFYANGPVAWVEEIVVRRQDRGRGIGRALMSSFEEWAATRGCALIALATRRAAPFYRALGYEESAVYFRKVLDDAATQ